MQLPVITHPYEKSIIQANERSYPINYIQYEFVDEYNTAYTINLNPNQKFIEIPEDKILQFKNHRYAITYKNPEPNKLLVNISSKPDIEDIAPSDYTDYKKYVKVILEAEEAYIGFK